MNPYSPRSAPGHLPGLFPLLLTAGRAATALVSVREWPPHSARADHPKPTSSRGNHLSRPVVSRRKAPLGPDERGRLPSQQRILSASSSKSTPPGSGTRIHRRCQVTRPGGAQRALDRVARLWLAGSQHLQHPAWRPCIMESAAASWRGFAPLVSRDQLERLRYLASEEPMRPRQPGPRHQRAGPGQRPWPRAAAPNPQHD